ncbi:MAG: lipopolysaccharide biosynthesis protein [Chitinophagaceae bacterium]|nr:lipopolysaccharide biosynthesis protein [Chitinophagaceae bacterium]
MTKLRDEQQHIDNDEISLKELIQKIQEWIAYLKTQWKLIIGIAALGGIIGFVYASFQKPSYLATTTFVLEEDKGGGGLGGAMGLASSFGFDLGGGGGGLFTSSNIIELMKSRLVVEKTLLNPVQIAGKEISLADYYIQINELKKGWDKKPALANINFPTNADRTKFSLEQDSILQTISAGLTKNNLVIAQKDKKVSIISLTVKTENELFSKLLCEQLLKETSDFYIETKSKKSRLNVDILQRQADSIRAELNGAITGVAAASDNVYNLNPAFNVKRTPSTRRQVDVQANTAILTQLVAQLELSKVSLRKETPLVQLIDRPILPLEKDKVGRLKSLVLGGFLAGFLTVLYLVFGQLYRKMVA